MVFERTEHEPDEYDPEEDLRDPESDSLTIPHVSIPEVETSEADVSSEIQTSFWLIVLTLNAAILAGSLGVLLLVFGYDPTYGAVLLVGGIVLSALASRRYRNVRPKLRENSVASTDSVTDDRSSESGDENDGDGDGDGDGEDNDEGGDRDEHSADRHTNTDPATETHSARSSESDAPETDQN